LVAPGSTVVTLGDWVGDAVEVGSLVAVDMFFFAEQPARTTVNASADRVNRIFFIGFHLLAGYCAQLAGRSIMKNLQFAALFSR
jgi:hypothetical protein